MQENKTFITIKDHKEGFPHHVSCRLSNPSKTNIGKISKVLLDKINSAVLSGTKINQLINASSLITWFEKRTHKQTSSFICFDLEHFYPSIYSNLFKESIEFARQFIQIFDDGLSIILVVRKTLLFKGTKKSHDVDFEVLMSCFDGADICEFVGT